MAYVAMRPGTLVSLEELAAHCREHIPERAAVPVRIAILATLPLTAVGKTFKPELRWRAIEHVLTEALAGKGIAARVDAGADAHAGTLARVHVTDAARVSEAREVLGAFAVACKVEAEPRQPAD
jgi:fatty-acyl-CoA synthase